MNYLDIVFVLLFAWAGWVGFKKGFIIELFTFLALFVGLYAGIHFSNYAAKFITEDMDVQSNYVPAISFTLTFLAVGAMVYFAGKAIEKVVKVVQLSPLNKIAGLGFGILKASFLIGGFIVVVDSYDTEKEYLPNDVRQGSLFYVGIGKMTRTCLPVLKESTKNIKITLDKNENQATS